MTKESAWKAFAKATDKTVPRKVIYDSGYDRGYHARAEQEEKELLKILNYLITLGDLPNVPAEVFLKKWRNGVVK